MVDVLHLAFGVHHILLCLHKERFPQIQNSIHILDFDQILIYLFSLLAASQIGYFLISVEICTNCREIALV